MFDDEEILRFCNMQSNSDEADKIRSYLKEHPEILNEYLNDEEWENFQAHTRIDPQLSEKLWFDIASASLKKSNFRRSLIIKVGSIAACIALGLYLFYGTFSKPEIRHATADNILKHVISNAGKDTLTVRLPDSSRVQLLPASEVAYDDSFPQTNRNIQLRGEAVFYAAHLQIPFVVKTDGLSVKDIGTVFSVRSFTEDSMIKVELFKGLVSVTALKDSAHSYYLHLGDKLLYNKASGNIVFRLPEKNVPSLYGKDRESKRNYTGLSGNHWYMFNNQPLSSVFDQLAEMYNTPIEYSKADVRGLTFIGRLDKSDSLLQLLESVAALNNLHITETGKGYRIYK